MTDEVVTRLYRALAEELHRRDHDPDRPVKVSELYQELVPYKEVRSHLGVELNADYEHALLRLLAGERDLLRLEPEQAREELRREVEAPYPFVGRFRKFSASNVWVNMKEWRGPAAEPDKPSGQKAASTRSTTGRAYELRANPAAGRPEPVGDEPRPRIAAESAPGRGAAAAERAPVQLHSDEPASANGPLGPAERMAHAGDACAFCAETLPEGRRVRFCPHCGGDQRLRPCPRCDAVLERGWKYCISCGHES